MGVVGPQSSTALFCRVRQVAAPRRSLPFPIVSCVLSWVFTCFRRSKGRFFHRKLILH